METAPGSDAGEPAAAAEQAVRALDESEHDGEESGPSPSAGAAAADGSDREAELEAEPAAAAEAVLEQAVPPGGASMAANLVSTIRSFLPMVSKPVEGQAGPAAGKQPVKVGMQSSICAAVLRGAELQAGQAGGCTPAARWHVCSRHTWRVAMLKRHVPVHPCLRLQVTPAHHNQ